MTIFGDGRHFGGTVVTSEPGVVAKVEDRLETVRNLVHRVVENVL
jgi:hypothetical protein